MGKHQSGHGRIHPNRELGHLFPNVLTTLKLRVLARIWSVRDSICDGITDSSGNSDFGTLDLTTGAFTKISPSPVDYAGSIASSIPEPSTPFCWASPP